MDDQEQTATDSDVNALRNNIPVGESRDYKVAAMGISDSETENKRDNVRVIAAFVTESDVDVDNCVLAEGARWPKRGEVARFTRTEKTLEVSQVPAE